VSNNDRELKLKLTAEDNISSAIKKVAAALGETGLGQSVTAASTAFLALKGAGEVMGAVFGRVNAAISATIDAASGAEASDRKLAASMVQTGNYTEKAYQAIQKLSGAMQAQIGISDDAVKDLASYGMNLGMSAEQAAKATEAAVNLGAALNIDANAAMKQLAITMTGTTGKLGVQVTALKGLTQEQLRSGAAIDLIAAKYRDFAANSSQTYEGALKKSKEAWGDVLKQIGFLITKNPAVISALSKSAVMFTSMAESIASGAQWLNENSDSLKNYGMALGIAVGVVGGYIAVTNAARVATVAWKIAQIALNSTMALSPVGIAIAAVAGLTLGIGYLIDNFDKCAGFAKQGLAAAFDVVTFQIRLLLKGIEAIVSLVDSDMAKSVAGIRQSMEGFSDQLWANGKAQVEVARRAEETAVAVGEQNDALKGLESQASASNQAMIKLETGFIKASEAAKSAIDKMKDVSPQLALMDWEENKKQFEGSLKDLQSRSKEVIIKLTTQIAPLDDAQKQLLEKAKEEETKAQLALKGLKIKSEMEVREARMKEVDLAISRERNKTFTVADEIKTKRIALAEEVRSHHVEMATQRMIEEQNIDRHGVEVMTQARLAARDLEMASYKEHLDAQMRLAVSSETEKQIALAQARAQMTQGLGGASEASGGADVKVAQEQARQQQLTLAMQTGEMNRQDYERAMSASRLQELQARNAEELAIHQEKAQLLMNDEMATRELLAASQMEFEASQAEIRMNQDLTEGERKIAIEQAEQNHQANMNQIRETQLQAEVTRQQKLRDSWGETLANIRLQQEKHGQFMGMLVGIQQSSQYQAMNQGLTAAASLMQSKNETMFNIGKGAAIAQASVNTFMAATGAFAALSSIPIVGPALATAAAAAIAAAGMMQVNNIRNQKLGGQAHEGLDEVPQSMSGRSFILNGGEAVLQPEANKDLRNAAKKINQGGGMAEQNFSNTFNVGNEMSESAKRDLQDLVINSIREASERGEAVVNQRGVVNG